MAKQTTKEILCIHVRRLYVTIKKEYETKEYAVYTILGYDANGMKDILGIG